MFFGKMTVIEVFWCVTLISVERKLGTLRVKCPFSSVRVLILLLSSVTLALATASACSLSIVPDIVRFVCALVLVVKLPISSTTLLNNR